MHSLPLLLQAGRTYPLSQGQRKKYCLWCYFHMYSVCLGRFFIICLINFFPVVNPFFSPLLLHYRLWKMIWKSYFIRRCICALKIGADLQRQVRCTVCSIRAQNAQQTFALTDKARQTKRDPLMLFIRSRSRCRTLRDTTGECEFCIITLLQTEKLIFTETRAITAFSGELNLRGRQRASESTFLFLLSLSCLFVWTSEGSLPVFFSSTKISK